MVRFHESVWGGLVRLYDCDDMALTLAIGTDLKDRSMFPLSQVEVLFDHVQNRLLLKVHLCFLSDLAGGWSIFSGISAIP